MKNRRFYIMGGGNRLFSVGSFVVLSPEDSHHLRHVLRIGTNESLILFDGSGREMEAVVDSFLPEGVKVRITRVHELPETSGNTKHTPLSGFCVDLALPLLKADKLEIVFRMASELGASSFLLFHSKRCIPQPDHSGFQKKRKRWERIIRDSIRISGRSIIPPLNCFDSLEDLLKNVAGNKRIILAYEQPALPLISEILREIDYGNFREEILSRSHSPKTSHHNAVPVDGIILITGPEGGFSPEEVDTAKDCGAMICSLGEGILKAETAPIAALSIILSFLGRI